MTVLEKLKTDSTLEKPVWDVVTSEPANQAQFNDEYVIDEPLESFNQPDQSDKAPPRTHSSLSISTVAGTFGASIFIKICGLALGVILARMLGPVGRGQLATAILWPTIFAGIGIFGINVALARRAANAHELGTITRTAILLALVSGTVTAFVGYLLLRILLPAQQQQILIFFFQCRQQLLRQMAG